MIFGVQIDHLMICYCIHEGHLTRFPCFNGPWQYYRIRWNIVIIFEEDIFGAFFPLEKRQILNPRITTREEEFMGPLSKIWLSGAIYFEALDDQSVKKIGRHLHWNLIRDKLKDRSQLRKPYARFCTPFLSRDPSLELGVGKCGQ